MKLSYTIPASSPLNALTMKSGDIGLVTTDKNSYDDEDEGESDLTGELVLKCKGGALVNLSSGDGQVIGAADREFLENLQIRLLPVNAVLQLMN